LQQIKIARKRIVGQMTLLSAIGMDIFAQDFEVDEIYYIYNEGPSGSSVSVSGSNHFDDEYQVNLSISKAVTYNGKTYYVTSIGDYAFFDCSSLTSITIPESVTSIGSSTFNGCTELNSVIIPNDVETISVKAFYNTNLKSVSMGTGVLSIGKDVFGYDDKSSGSQPVKVTWLTNTPPTGYQNAVGEMNYVANDQYALYNKTVYPFLSSVFEVDGVKYVPVSPSERTCDVIDCAYDKSLPTVNIGETVVNKGISLHVRQVHDYACYGHPDIQTLTISHQGNIGNYAFQGCTNLKSESVLRSLWEM